MKKDVIKTIANDAANKIYKEGLTDEAARSFAEETVKSISSAIAQYAERAQEYLRILNSCGVTNKMRVSDLTTDKNKDKKKIVAVTMQRAYKLIMEFRTFITKEKIEYLIQYEGKGMSTIAILSTEQVLSAASLASLQGGGLKLNISSASVRQVIENDPTSEIAGQLIQMVKKVLSQIIEINRINGKEMSQEEFNKMREKMIDSSFKQVDPGKKSWINQGYALEAALKIVLETEDWDTLEDIAMDKRYKAYFDAIENVAVYRSGGDLDKKATEQLQNKAKNLGQNFKTLMTDTQLQVKRIRQKAAAQLITLRSIMADLSSIILLYQLTKAGPDDMMLKRFKEFFTDSSRSTQILDKLKKEISVEMESDAVVKEVFSTLERFFGSK